MNQYITENIQEAKDYLNRVEEMGPPAMRIAERILDSNKVFIHTATERKEAADAIATINQEYEKAKNDAINQNNTIAESYEKHINIANYLAALEYEKLTRIIGFWDKFNIKFQNTSTAGK